MASYSVAEARNNLSKLIERAEKGETVEITRHGKVAVRLVGVAAEHPPPTDWRAALQYVIENAIVPAKLQTEDSVTLIRRLRDESDH